MSWPRCSCMSAIAVAMFACTAICCPK
jgi:hypothetical protein